MDRFAVVLILVSFASLHVMYRYGTLIRLHTGIYLCVVGTEIEVDIESLALPWVTHTQTLDISCTCSSAAFRVCHDRHEAGGAGGGRELFTYKEDQEITE